MKHTPEELAAAEKMVVWLRAHPQKGPSVMGADLVLNLFLLGQDDAAYALLDGLPDKPQEQSGG